MDLNLEQKESTKIFVDNQAAIAIPITLCFMGKLRFVTLVYCKSENQIADLFTKPLSVSRFELLRQNIGVCSS